MRTIDECAAYLRAQNWYPVTKRRFPFFRPMTSSRSVEEHFRIWNGYPDFLIMPLLAANISDGIANSCIRAYMIFSTGAR